MRRASCVVRLVRKRRCRRTVVRCVRRRGRVPLPSMASTQSQAREGRGGVCTSHVARVSQQAGHIASSSTTLGIRDVSMPRSTPPHQLGAHYQLGHGERHPSSQTLGQRIVAVQLFYRCSPPAETRQTAANDTQIKTVNTQIHRSRLSIHRSRLSCIHVYRDSWAWASQICACQI